MRTTFVEVGSGTGALGGTHRVYSAAHGPEDTGRHRRVEAAALTDTGRHRAVALPAPPAAPAPAPARRRHAADAAPATHPDARVQPRGRRSRRLVAGTVLVTIAFAPVLARSSSALGMHDAVAAEVAANPDRADDTLEALSRGGALVGLATPTPAAGPATAGPEEPAGTPSGRAGGTATGSTTRTTAGGTSAPADAAPGSTPADAGAPAPTGTSATDPGTGTTATTGSTGAVPSETGTSTPTTGSTGSTPPTGTTGSTAPPVVVPPVVVPPVVVPPVVVPPLVLPPPVGDSDDTEQAPEAPEETVTGSAPATSAASSASRTPPGRDADRTRPGRGDVAPQSTDDAAPTGSPAPTGNPVEDLIATITATMGG